MIEKIKIGEVSWLHLADKTNHDLEELMELYNFHPLDIEDCKELFNQRPKLDEYDDYYFLILHFPYFDKTGKFIRTREEKIFWGRDFIVTMGKGHWIISRFFNTIKNKVERGEELDIVTSDDLLYEILEFLFKETMVVVRKVGDSVEVAGSELFSKKTEKVIEHISITRKNIIMLNTVFKPQLRVFNKIESGNLGFDNNMEEYWGNILDRLQKIWDLTEDYSELIEGYSKTFDSLQVNKSNEIMKVLTMISSIILPLTFITGMYGMNVSLPMEGHSLAFVFLCFMMLCIACAMYFYFKKKRWM